MDNQKGKADKTKEKEGKVTHHRWIRMHDTMVAVI